jgi:hypothetical protein
VRRAADDVGVPEVELDSSLLDLDPLVVGPLLKVLTLL